MQTPLDAEVLELRAKLEALQKSHLRRGDMIDQLRAELEEARAALNNRTLKASDQDVKEICRFLFRSLSAAVSRIPIPSPKVAKEAAKHADYDPAIAVGLGAAMMRQTAAQVLAEAQVGTLDEFATHFPQPQAKA
jgi:hypothetical protein